MECKLNTTETKVEATKALSAEHRETFENTSFSLFSNTETRVQLPKKGRR